MGDEQAPAQADQASPRPASADDRRRELLLGLAGVLLMIVPLGALHALTAPAFEPPDETAHVLYALEISDGRLPSIDEFPPPDRIPGMREGLSVWTANHPPLFYLLAGVPLRAGIAAGQPLGGFTAARLLSVALLAAAALLIAWLALLLLPTRPAVAVAAPAAALTLPYIVHVSGLVYGDTLGLVTATAGLVGIVAVLRGGLGRRAIAFLVLASALAALARASGLAVAAAAVAAIAAAALLHGSGPVIRRLRAAVLPAAAVAVAVVASSGWFYLRNYRLYGDITGGSALMEMFGRSPTGPLLGQFANTRLLRNLHRQLWSRTDSGFHLPGGHPLLHVAELVTILALAGLALLAVRALARRLPLRRHDAVSWLFVGGFLAVMVVSVADFASRGGSPHARYVFPAAAVIGLGMVLGLMAFPGAGRGALVIPLLAAQVAAALVAWTSYLRSVHDAAEGVAAHQVGVEALRAVGVPAPALLIGVGAGAIAVGFVLSARAVWVLSGARHAPVTAR